VTTAL